MTTQKQIPHDQLVPMDLFEADFPIKVMLDYASPRNLLFGEAIYKPIARLWLYKPLAQIVLRAAEICAREAGWRLLLHDGLRTVDAQERMLRTARVQKNPQWLEEPRLLSPPGAGAHPRGMAVDISPETLDGQMVNMGTPFDFLASYANVDQNPAHRGCKSFGPHIQDSRDQLEKAMVEAGREFDHEIVPLPEEWWDFRFSSEIYQSYAPLSDADLPPQMRLTHKRQSDLPPNYTQLHFDTLYEKISKSVKALA